MTYNQYYYQFRPIDLHPVRFDTRNIPFVYLPGVGNQYHPITVANWGLHYYNLYSVSNSQDDLRKAVHMAEWLVENQKDGIWFISFPNNFYNIPAPWPNAMAQGQAIGLLSRIGVLQKKKNFITIAKSALHPFTKISAEGGVLAKTEFGDFYEEYPSAPPSLVLNGFIFSLLGLYDLWQHHRIDKAGQLYKNGVSCLSRIIDKYDTGYWTRYDLFPMKRLASQEYHELHIILTRAMGRLHREEKFVALARRWQKYRNSIGSQAHWLIDKLLEKTVHRSTVSPLKLRVR